jgi:hypothetical protein
MPWLLLLCGVHRPISENSILTLPFSEYIDDLFFDFGSVALIHEMVREIPVMRVYAYLILELRAALMLRRKLHEICSSTD